MHIFSTILDGEDKEIIQFISPHSYKITVKWTKYKNTDDEDIYLCVATSNRPFYIVLATSPDTSWVKGSWDLQVDVADIYAAV